LKIRLAAQLGSKALRGDGILTTASGVLAGMTLAALLANSWLGWWWADPVAALVIGAALVIEADRVATNRWGFRP
jgi:divalent metal cation (Fe/Co/Zn/Cd) transporter